MEYIIGQWVEWLWMQWSRLCMGPIPRVPLNQNQSIGDYLETKAEWTVQLSHWTIVPHTRQGSFFMRLLWWWIWFLFSALPLPVLLQEFAQFLIEKYWILHQYCLRQRCLFYSDGLWQCMYDLMILSSYHVRIHLETVNSIEQQNTL